MAAIRQLHHRGGAGGGDRLRRPASAGAPGSSSERLEEARRYVEAQQLLRDGKPAEAAAAFAALAEDASSGYRVLAQLRAAEAQAQAGDRAAASAALDRLAADGDARTGVSIAG